MSNGSYVIQLPTLESYNVGDIIFYDVNEFKRKSAFYDDFRATAHISKVIKKNKKSITITVNSNNADGSIDVENVTVYNNKKIMPKFVFIALYRQHANHYGGGAPNLDYYDDEDDEENFDDDEVINYAQ